MSKILTEFAADAVLNAVYNRCPEDSDFRGAAKRLCEKYPELTYDFDPNVKREKTESVMSFFQAYLAQLGEIFGDSKSYTDQLYFALMCKIETFSLYDCREMCLFAAGEPNNSAAQTRLLIPAMYLASGKTAYTGSVLYRETRMLTAYLRESNSRITDEMSAEVVRPLLEPKKPTDNTRKKYRDIVPVLQQDLYRMLSEIRYLSEDMCRNFAEKSSVTLGDILHGEAPHQLKGYHSFIPVRAITKTLNESETAPNGTTATFTFGILLK